MPLFPAHGLGSAAPPGLAGIIAPSEYDALMIGTMMGGSTIYVKLFHLHIAKSYPWPKRGCPECIA